MTINIFDTNRLLQNRVRALARFDDHGFLYDWCAENLRDRLTMINRDFVASAQIGVRGKVRDALVMDVQGEIDILGSEECIPFKKQSLDLVLSNLHLHTTNDLPGTLLQIRQSLKPDGLFMASIFGGETLSELRHSLMQAESEIYGGVSPRVAPFADKQDIGALMQRAGFALPVVDSEKVTVTYDNIFKLMHDLRYMGEGNAVAARSRKPVGKAFFMRAGQIYAEKFAESDGKLPASFDIIFMLGWAPHESQQKPLKPGSAQHRLADALGGEEVPI